MAKIGHGWYMENPDDAAGFKRVRFQQLHCMAGAARRSTDRAAQ
jgi:hypothetical protein